MGFCGGSAWVSPGRHISKVEKCPSTPTARFERRAININTRIHIHTILTQLALHAPPRQYHANRVVALALFFLETSACTLLYGINHKKCPGARLYSYWETCVTVITVTLISV